MIEPLHSLARNEYGWIPVVIFILIWAISAISQILKKAAEQQKEMERRRKVRESIQHPQPAPTRPAPSIPQPKKRPTARKWGQKPIRAAETAIRIEPEPAPSPPLSPAPVAPSRRTAGPRITLTPATLRQQFILTEILARPVALREE